MDGRDDLRQRVGELRDRIRQWRDQIDDYINDDTLSDPDPRELPNAPAALVVEAAEVIAALRSTGIATPHLAALVSDPGMTITRDLLEELSRVRRALGQSESHWSIPPR